MKRFNLQEMDVLELMQLAKEAGELVEERIQEIYERLGIDPEERLKVLGLNESAGGKNEILH